MKPVLADISVGSCFFEPSTVDMAGATATDFEDRVDAGTQEHERWRDDPDMEGQQVMARSASVQQLQRELGLLVDATRVRHFEQVLADSCRWSHLRRLRELRHGNVCHRWLWHILRTGTT